MKKILLAFILLAACTPEDKVDPAHASTFVRYFNGGNSDEAQQVVQTADGGFLILVNTEIKTSELTPSNYKIKLIKTDGYGNQIWQRFYPSFESDSDVGYEDHGKNFKGNNLLTSSDGGYVIAGQDIQNGSQKLMMIRVTPETLKSEKVKYDWTTLNTSFNVEGMGIATNLAGNYWVLGSIINSTTDKNMILAKFGQSKIDSLWSYQYGAGQNTLAPRLFLNEQNDAFWGGTIQKSNTNTSVRFVKVQANESNTGGIDFDLPLSNPAFIETGNDFCRYGSAFAVVGSTNHKATGSGDLDIMFKRISNDGIELSSKSYPIKDQQQQDQQQNETGNSLCATNDGGLLLLGTIDTQGDLGRGDKDYYLIKINAFGDVEWTQDYGSKFEDDGVNVIQASDGGYVVLGTSSIGRVKTIMLMKTDKNGKIE